MIRFDTFEDAKSWVKRIIFKDFQEEVLAKIDDYFEMYGEFAFS